MMNAAAARALTALREGNERFASAHPAHPRSDAARRAEVRSGQHPFAAVISCSDSRVPPEIVFDQGIGDLFVVRTAGNVLDDVGLASIEYAVEHLGVALVVVLGHGGCGAVRSAAAGGEAPGHLGRIVEALAPSLAHARRAGGDIVEAAVRENVRSTVSDLRGSEPILRPLVEEGRVSVVGACYSMEHGTVELID